MTTIRDISRRTGVSIATISRVMSQPEKVAEHTRRQVLKAIEESGYQPNLLARNFRANKSNVVLVLVPNIANPFFSNIIRGIEKVASELGYSVLLGDCAHSDEREDTYATLAATKRADGILQFNARLPGPVENPVRSNVLPFVNVCELIPDFDGPSVSIDNVDAAQRMTRHLLDLGHRRIGIVTGPTSTPLTKARMQGVRAALKDFGCGADLAFVVNGDFTMESGYGAVSDIDDGQMPDAVFCFNDEMAIGVIKRLSDLGLEVPGDVSVAGFDNIEFSRYIRPSLTTISQPTTQIGETAMRLLFELMEGRTPETPQIILPTDLIVRDTTSSARPR